MVERTGVEEGVASTTSLCTGYDPYMCTHLHYAQPCVVLFDTATTVHHCIAGRGNRGGRGGRGGRGKHHHDHGKTPQKPEVHVSTALQGTIAAVGVPQLYIYRL